jgi:hypothetical protein
MSIRATRTPETRGSRYAGPPSVRYDTSPAWPGIYTGFDARCQCTRTYLHGRYQVKYLNRICPNHARWARP